MSYKEILITNKKVLIPKHKCEHTGYEYYKYEVTKFSEGNQCCVAVYEIPPGKAGYPYHFHTKSEEVFYIISGVGILQTHSGDRTVAAGDIIICPPTEKGAHKLINSSKTENLVYMDFDTVAFPEVIFYPHSNKVGVFVNDELKRFYKEGSDVDYYAGE